MFLLFKDWGDYKLTFAMTLVTQCSLLHLRGKNSFLDKINDKLTCTGSLKPSVGWGWAVSLFTRTKSQWNVPRSTCSIFLTYALVQCLSFVGYMCVWRSKSNKKKIFWDSGQGTWMVTFHFKDARSTTRKWWSWWQTRCLIRVLYYSHFKLKCP